MKNPAIKTDNPAGRLYEILDKTRSKSKTSRVRVVWAEVLDIDPNDSLKILSSLTELVKLVAESKKRIQQIQGINTDLYLQPFENIEKAFANLNFTQQWEPIKNLLDEPTMLGLAYCADYLSREAGEKEIDPKKLAELLKAVEALQKEVLASDLPEELKSVLIENLEKMHLSILGYRINGAEGIQRAIEMNLGSVFLHGDLIKAENKKQVMKKFYRLLLKALEIIGPALGKVLVIDGIERLLLGSG